MSVERASNWSITINNPTEEERKALAEPPTFVKKVMYQDEVGAEGTLHIQGYVSSAQVRFSQIKKWLPRAHIEVARDKNALMKYVQKQDTSVEGTQKTVETEYLTMDKALRAIAQVKKDNGISIDGDKYLESSRSEKKELVKDEFWKCVNLVLKEKPGQVGLFTNPQMERAWINTRTVWINFVAQEYNAPTGQEEASPEAEASGAQASESE